MSDLKEFLSLRGPGENCIAATERVLEEYSGRVPACLGELWREHGFCSYADGFIRVTNPAELAVAVKLWMGTRSKHIAIARTAFGHLFLWNGKAVQLLHVHYGGTTEIAPDVELLFNSSLCSDRYLDKGLERKVFLKAQKKLGALAADECFTYEPAISLGGSGKPDTLRKVKLLPQLAILAQLNADT